ncbi:RNA-guided endonuclease InsQ/TnpB family protein, partial [Tolypothrix sp. VBCCA 56010]|uniref:RNA-guided endonuclease InsQ/TnpB family protein n=1 Tax=Tolypothrix sp. VBCCA 56010 TaxID=3137731 RepID=UPI003D7C9576
MVKSGKSIKIPTLGTFRLQEPLKENYISQTFTISREESSAWYVSFAVDAERIPPIMHEVVQPVGIDLGVKTFATVSDGTEIEAPKPYKIAKTKLGDLQYRNRNKKRGNRKTGEKASNNAKKYYKKLASFHKQIADKRQDFLNKTTTSICKKYAHIKIENLNVSGMIANRKLSSAISDLGFYEFRRQLEYKTPIFGSKLDIVDQWYPSSKQCRKCGHKHSELKLKDRVFNCQGGSPDRSFCPATRRQNATIAKIEICTRRSILQTHRMENAVGSVRQGGSPDRSFCPATRRPNLTLVDCKEPTPQVEARNVERCPRMSSKYRT